MKPTDHNRILGILFCIYGGIICLGALALMLGAPLTHALSASNSNSSASDWGPLFFLGTVFLIVGLAPLTTGIGLLQLRPWARMASIIISFPMVLSFPLGLGISIYTWVFMFGGAGRALYHSPKY